MSQYKESIQRAVVIQDPKKHVHGEGGEVLVSDTEEEMLGCLCGTKWY